MDKRRKQIHSTQTQFDTTHIQAYACMQAYKCIYISTREHTHIYYYFKGNQFWLLRIAQTFLPKWINAESKYIQPKHNSTRLTSKHMQAGRHIDANKHPRTSTPISITIIKGTSFEDRSNFFFPNCPFNYLKKLPGKNATPSFFSPLFYFHVPDFITN